MTRKPPPDYAAAASAAEKLGDTDGAAMYRAKARDAATRPSGSLIYAPKGAPDGEAIGPQAGRLKRIAGEGER